MAEAAYDSRTPESLYDLSIAAVISKRNWWKFSKKELRLLPDNVVFDVFYKLYEIKKLCILGVEFSDLDLFARMLKLTKKRCKLLTTFQALVDHGSGVLKELMLSFYEKSQASVNGMVDVGLRLGGFLSEAGWFSESIAVLQMVEGLCNDDSTEQTSHILLKKLQCYHKLLFVQTVYCKFKEAEESLKKANETVEKLESLQLKPNLAGLYSQFSLFYFVRCEYDQAYKWSSEAIKLLTPNLPKKVIVDVLRQATKACVVKRKFKKAGLLVNQAVCLATQLYEVDSHPNYSDALMDYGFYLLNVDLMSHSVQIYQKALKIRKSVFDKNNIYVAIAHEDLAYALYVYEYSSGRFSQAREYSERAIKILNNLVSPDHLMLASAKRVKALILEEIALDIPNVHSNLFSPDDLLSESEKLHMAALELTYAAFGEMNVQTAKHYGNLGRLYQSMKKFSEAEKMHLRAIAIKKELLGDEDYEVGLSIGHLASLYNYHMRQHRKAEKLYFRSIAISLKLFGDSYSGLEYDYRGLVHVYNELNEMDRKVEFKLILSNWKDLRTRYALEKSNSVNMETNPKPISEIRDQFFEDK